MSSGNASSTEDTTTTVYKCSTGVAFCEHFNDGNEKVKRSTVGMVPDCLLALALAAAASAEVAYSFSATERGSGFFGRPRFLTGQLLEHI